MIKIEKVKKGTVKPVKPFKTLDEEAAFWDTHDITGEIDEGTLVGFHQANKQSLLLRNKTGTLTIRFQPKHITDLKKEAARLGVGPTTLVRMWILEKLHQSA